MLVIIAQMIVSNDADAEKLCSAALTVSRHTHQESGCHHYSFARDIENPLIIRIAEQWESENVLERHMRTPHLQSFMSTIADLATISTSATMFDGVNERDPAALMPGGAG